ncbi:ATP-binding cassette sub-family A member 3 [Ceratobasidium sp. AG-Ba]|nr:ATP-binding cassette sub-family A member 3 [Ceratobasidium sp. AG-Ba]
MLALAPRKRVNSKPTKPSENLSVHIYDDPNKSAMRAWTIISWTRYHLRKRILLVALTGLILLLLSWKHPQIANMFMDRRSLPTPSGPFPNVETLPIQGKHMIGLLSVERAPLSCPSQATFIAVLLKRNILTAVPLIARLQDIGCPIHLLIGPDQAETMRQFLEVVLPAMTHIYVFQRVLEAEGAALAILHHARTVQTPWVWIMGLLDSGIEATLDPSNSALVYNQFPRIEFPLGIRGIRLHNSKLFCVPQSDKPEPVAFLIPPFMIPTALLRQAGSGTVSSTSTHVWASLGSKVASITGLGMGGMLFPASPATQSFCDMPYTQSIDDQEEVSDSVILSLEVQLLSWMPTRLRFAFTLPDLESMHSLAPTICRMLRNGHDMYISVRGDSSETGSTLPKDWTYANLGCHLHYYLDETSQNGSEFDLTLGINNWCLSQISGAKILIITEVDSRLGRARIPIAKRLCLGTTAIIHLPYSDLRDSEWLAMLTFEEWQAWDLPEIELAVITHDRPWSLARLLNSIKQAHYFGDSVNVVINLEQTADSETRHIAEAFSMDLHGGRVSVRHRIVYAGLMAAVVESWYPHGSHSYGVILEDDVELSPMFYAWTKFCVLRYRYNSANNHSSQLYGVSLYQPKVTELRMEGRRPFNPKNMFAELRFKHPHTPYLSQVPCSWGAVYFPEHWREFQRYLSLRLSGHLMPVDELVVPDLRSNNWSRSWKKFFNEMVFLRGYVSLYPNYSHFVSLSTNHLERGEHVPADLTEEKQKYYFLPLMQDAANAHRHQGATRGVTLLDLPLANLPEWSTLPVLDLWGDVSSMEKLQAAGRSRREEMSVCNEDEAHQDSLLFLCPANKTVRFEQLHESPASIINDDAGLDLMQG